MPARLAIVSHTLMPLVDLEKRTSYVTLEVHAPKAVDNMLNFQHIF